MAYAMPGPEPIPALEGYCGIALFLRGPWTMTLAVDDDAVHVDVALFAPKLRLARCVVFDAETNQLDDPVPVAFFHGVSLFFSGLVVPGQRETKGVLDIHNIFLLVRIMKERVNNFFHTIHPTMAARPRKPQMSVFLTSSFLWNFLGS